MMGKGAIVSCFFKHIQPSLWVRNHHANVTKGHRLKLCWETSRISRVWCEGHCGHFLGPKTMIIQQLRLIRSWEEALQDHYWRWSWQLFKCWIIPYNSRSRRCTSDAYSAPRACCVHCCKGDPSGIGFALGLVDIWGNIDKRLASSWTHWIPA